MTPKIFKPADAAKLEAPDRPTWLPPQEVIATLRLKAGDIVADIGAGTGYFALPVARVVGPTGRVLAVDSQPEMLELLRAKLASDANLGNIEPTLGSAEATTLADAAVDAILVANVWHELDDLVSVVKELRRIIKPLGRLTVLDWRTDVSQPPGPPLAHRITANDVARILERGNWGVLSQTNVGSYSYAVTAMAPQ